MKIKTQFEKLCQEEWGKANLCPTTETDRKQ